VDFWATS